MSRLSIRPRPLDIHKKLPIVKSLKDFEDDDALTPRNSQFLRFAAAATATDTESEVQHVPAKKLAHEIPIPDSVIVDTYERDYSQTFNQPNSYLRAGGTRAELGDFIEYDLDNEDEDWLQEFNRDEEILMPEKFETVLFKLEVLDFKARERAGVIAHILGALVPVLLQRDAAYEVVQVHSISYSVFQSVYNYWKEKRERWQKPILRRLQPPPPANDTNPFNVFRPREKAHRLHTRRMQRRENNVLSFEKLRQVRRNLEQAKSMFEALIKREEKKRDVMDSEISLQRIQMEYKHETELFEDSLALPGFQNAPYKFESNEDEFMDEDNYLRIRPAPIQNPSLVDSNTNIVPAVSIKQDIRRRHMQFGWLHKLDPQEPVLLFTKPLVPEKLASAGIVPPSEHSTKSDPSTPPYRCHGRIGRGGRIVFDRWNPLMMNRPVDYEPPKPRS
ncbi:hypothetical protein ACFE04_014228 [Oxalis oulophora]